MLKKGSIKQNIQDIINEKTQIETHIKLKNSLREAGVKVVALPKISVDKAIKHHINELMDAAEVKNQILSQKKGKAMYINASTLKHYVSKLVKHFVKLELANQQ